jgi:hypothetical protein
MQPAVAATRVLAPSCVKHASADMPGTHPAPCAMQQPPHAGQWLISAGNSPHTDPAATNTPDQLSGRDTQGVRSAWHNMMADTPGGHTCCTWRLLSSATKLCHHCLCSTQPWQRLRYWLLNTQGRPWVHQTHCGPPAVFAVQCTAPKQPPNLQSCLVLLLCSDCTPVGPVKLGKAHQQPCRTSRAACCMHTPCTTPLHSLQGQDCWCTCCRWTTCLPALPPSYSLYPPLAPPLRSRADTPDSHT